MSLFLEELKTKFVIFTETKIFSPPQKIKNFSPR